VADGRNTSSGVSRRRIAFTVFALLAVAAVVDLRSRHRETELDHLALVLELKVGDSVADVGAGSGELSIAIAKFVGPEGQIYATEIDPALLDKINNLARQSGVHNVKMIAGDKLNTELPPNCCDAIFLREVYHHLSNPTDIDRSLFVSLKPGGRLAIIDFEPILDQPVPVGVPRNRGGHGVPKEIVKRELKAAGFDFVKAMNWPISPTIEHYCLVFKKPSASLSASVSTIAGSCAFGRQVPAFARLTRTGFDCIARASLVE